MPSRDDFQKALDDIFNKNERKDNTFIDVRAGDLHRQVGCYPGTNHRMPLCCEVMRKNKEDELGDHILCEPPAGDGAQLKIRYFSPRPQKSSEQSTKTISSQSQSFPWHCAYCKSKLGQDPGVIDFNEHDCPVCHGNKQRLFQGSRAGYITCPRCEGNGGIKRDNILIRLSDPCPLCKGWGIISKADYLNKI